VTAESLGWQLRSALPPMRLHSVSLYNVDADVLWLSEGALGPDEHNVVVEAIEGQKADKAQNYFEYGMEDGRIGIFLPIRGPRGDLAGTVMILADMKSVTEGTMERIVTPQIRTILVKIAMFMRRSSPTAAAEAAAEVAMPDAATKPAPVNLSSTTVIEKLPAAATAALAAAAAPTLGPREVEQILELELIAEPPPPPPAPAAAAAEKNRKGQVAPAPSPAAPKGAPSRAGASPPAPANVARGVPTLSAVPTKPAPAAAPAAPARAEIEVLQFDADISIPVAKPAAAPVKVPDSDVLAFEPDFQVPTAKPAAAPSADIEVLSFDAEPPVVTAAPAWSSAPAAPAVAAAPPVLAAAPPVAPAASAPTAAPIVQPATKSAPVAAPVAQPATKSAPIAAPAAQPAAKSAPVAAPKPAATNSTSSVRAFTPSPATTASVPVVNAAPAASAKPAPATASAPAPVAASAPAPVAKAAPVSPSSTQTTAVPVMPAADDDEISGLINDTGPQPKLDETTTIEAAPQLPPLEPLSVEESAADLTLFAQELIKLRSSGRTRRYEVLARSQRDANRNEVPAAFVADSARGKDGAALDLMVMDRLLSWLGKHGEAIWDSEPASFSVNLSIGAIEDESFLGQVEQWLEKHSVPAEYIGFEITEFACIQCKAAVQRFFDRVEKMGCFLVIDNFAFDSTIFELLGSKALRHVKLDPKLTDAAMKDKLPQALVVAILQACKVLGVHCVAKRVESKSSLQWLTAVGCDFAQTFSLHKPLPLESLASGQPIKALRE
jgi:EAL domain-containing protein (putative c-di-GMP-specific phosphodiesterase class I)